MKVIDQKKGIKQDFGNVLRSSAVFYYAKTEALSSTISFLNHWKLKRGLDTCIIANIRKLNGMLISREEIFFENGCVLNYSPFDPADNFEGSIEIEVFSLKNMVIPVAGILGIYESPNGISMVHSYARTYSNHELEEHRVITEGEDSGWTARDSEDVFSFCALHNGGRTCEPQEIRLTLTNHRHERCVASFMMSAINPYQTVIIEPRNHFEKLLALLDGKPGNIAISYRLQESFTRLLIGNRKIDGSDFQITHTNFNYSIHQTDKVEGEHEAFMYIPQWQEADLDVVVYPDCDRGNYRVSVDGQTPKPFTEKKTVTLRMSKNNPHLLTFETLKGEFPSRLVTAMRASLNSERIPAECSLNIIHRKYYNKFYTWGLAVKNDDLTCRIFFTECEAVYGKFTKDHKATLFLYSDNSFEHLETSLTLDLLEDLKRGMLIEDTFEDAPQFLRNSYGYLALKTEYPGFIIYSTLANSKGSVTLEHWF